MKLALLLCAMVLAGAGARAQGFDPARVGPPLSGQPDELYLPPGGPAGAAVVVLHGCSGVGPHERDWARRLASWGYAALVVDSFAPRGYREVCNRGRLVPPEAQARDAFDAAGYLRAVPQVQAARVGVIGFSHGGWAVLKAVLAGVLRRPGEPPFAAAVAYYPGCDPPASPLETDTLILIGEADEWTPVARCRRWRDLLPAGPHSLAMKTYPGALHAFDALLPPHDFAGHHVGADPAARADSYAETRRFFAARLGP